MASLARRARSRPRHRDLPATGFDAALGGARPMNADIFYLAASMRTGPLPGHGRSLP